MNNKKLGEVFVTSDTHFGDKRLINFTRTNFKTVEEMDQYIIKQWNSVVKKDDIVIHLGDVIGNKNGDNDSDLKTRWMQVKKLNGKKIIVTGNYDREFNKNLFYEAGFTDIGSDKFQIDNIIFSHEPIVELINDFINIHGHIHNGTLCDLIQTSNRHFNAIGELHNYKPIKIKELLK
ncbi:metallophosphoesterase [Mycoplasma marinum]|uniref:Calcineurin-like phosphoesterase domain-containing protein n=1 Tax=Mycoplasma marinum TaxID=1937190 RepID=A0A4R0XU44_9MOLU|nr:metallophosphoesterase [Mycoplasma marinum]TCG11189.1 hypothetical protein C4B24_02805 [Mycoplasma marinum]